MTRNEAIDLVAYNDWANARLFAACAQLSEDGWTRDLGGSYPTLLQLVAHVTGVEWIWLQRWQGESPASAPAWMKDPEPAVLRGVLGEVEERRREFVSEFTDDDLQRDVQYTLLDGSGGALPLTVLLRHVVNHSTYHRGQMASMLRQLNVTPPATDLVLFALERQS